MGDPTPGYDFRIQDSTDLSATNTYSTVSELLMKRNIPYAYLPSQILLADKASEIIHASAEKDNPFFLYLPFQSVHDPMQVPDEYLEMYPDVESELRKIFMGKKDTLCVTFLAYQFYIYIGMVTAMDDAVGKVVEALKESGAYENTIIVFTSDVRFYVARNFLLIL